MTEEEMPLLIDTESHKSSEVTLLLVISLENMLKMRTKQFKEQLTA